MLTIVMASLFAAASDSVPVKAASLDKNPVRYCRPLMIGISRSNDVYICRSKAGWAQWDSCTGATRYCTPAQKASIGGYTAFPLNEDSRIVCRVLKATGSRLSAQRTCLPQREWQRMWDNSRETMTGLQDRHSTRPPQGQ